MFFSGAAASVESVCRFHKRKYDTGDERQKTFDHTHLLSRVSGDDAVNDNNNEYQETGVLRQLIFCFVRTG